MERCALETYRKLSTTLCVVLSAAFSLFELYTVGFGILSPFAQRGTMLAFASVLVFLLMPTAGWPRKDDLGGWPRLAAAAWDWGMIAAALFSCAYVIYNEEGLADRIGAETPLDLFVAALGPVMMLDMVRRAAGLPLFLVTCAVIIYSYTGDVALIVLTAGLAVAGVLRAFGRGAALALSALLLLSLPFPGVRAYLDPSAYPFQGESHARMSAYLWLTSEGTFGTIAATMSQFIFIFILFAALLEATGTGQILIRLALAVTGRFRGGPAQAAVVASSMFGMVSGSTMANVVSTGTFTIPLMIRTGFSRRFAGAVEAVASSGGQLVPPVMGASVFIMSELIGVPYVFLMLYAVIPAFLYYLSLSASVYFESCRLRMEPLERSEIPDGWEQIRKGGYLLIPIALLLASITSGETPGRAGFKAVVSLIVVVDLVRSLRWARARWGLAGVLALGAVAALLAASAYGPIPAPAALAAPANLPFIGPMPWNRILLSVAGVGVFLVPGLRGLPGSLFLGLAIARWQFPSELAWIAGFPFVGPLVPLALAGLAVVLILLPVWEPEEPVPAEESARAMGRAVWSGLQAGARNSLGLVAATTCIGTIVGLLVLAALGVRISILVTEVASTSLFLAFFLVMIASLVMGMGLPTVAAYLLLVIVVAPSIAKLGAPLVAAHMFIFYFGVISSITPPVALAAYAAAGLSGADPMRTGFTACRLALSAFIVPFLFVYYPELLLIQGTWWQTAYFLAVSCAGVVIVSMVTMGYGLVPLGAVSRIFLGASALFFFMRSPWSDALGVFMGAGHIACQWFQAKRKGTEAPVEAL